MGATNYIYDGNQYLAEADETDTVDRLYTNEPDTYTHLISQADVSSGDSLYYHYDAMGSTRQVTDEMETVTDEFTFDAWGNRLSRTGTNDIPFQYVGEYGYYDGQMNNDYAIPQFYDPKMTRWTNRESSLNTVSVSGYVYLENNPATFRAQFNRQLQQQIAIPTRRHILYRQTCRYVTAGYGISCLITLANPDCWKCPAPFSCCAAGVSSLICLYLNVWPPGAPPLEIPGMGGLRIPLNPCLLGCLNLCMFEHWLRKDTDEWKDAQDKCREKGPCSKDCCIESTKAEQAGLTECLGGIIKPSPCVKECDVTAAEVIALRLSEGIRQQFAQNLCCEGKFELPAIG